MLRCGNWQLTPTAHQSRGLLIPNQMPELVELHGILLILGKFHGFS